MAYHNPMRETKERTESSINRVLSLLDRFTEEHPTWSVEQLAEFQQVARATVYRYLRVLVESGFLVPLGGGSYGLGPRVIQMDRQIRLSDPLLQIATPIMQSHRDKVAGAQLLCRYYRDSLLSIYDDCTDPRIKTSFDRGRPFSLLLGSPSRIILANLPLQELERLFLDRSGEIAQAGLGDSWQVFRQRMQAVREQGYATASDIDKSLVGVAAPIFVAPDTVTASLCLARLKKEVSEQDLAFLGGLAKAMATKISTQLQRADGKLQGAVQRSGSGRGRANK